MAAAREEDLEGRELSEEELQQEQASDLPAREALSLIGVGGTAGGAPIGGPLDNMGAPPPHGDVEPIGTEPAEPPPQTGPGARMPYPS